MLDEVGYKRMRYNGTRYHKNSKRFQICSKLLDMYHVSNVYVPVLIRVYVFTTNYTIPWKRLHFTFTSFTFYEE